MALIDEIRAKCPPDMIAEAKRTNELGPIVAAVNAGRVKIVETRIRSRHVLSALGAVDGQAVVDALIAAVPADGLTPTKKALRPLATVVEMLDPQSTEGLDVGDLQARAQLDALGAQGVVMTTVQANKLKALAERPDPITDFDVSMAVHSPARDGTWII